MDTRKYEVHSLLDKELPIVFHYDIVEARSYLGNWHEEIELLYCTKGEGQIICDGVEYNVSSGDLVVINTNELHRTFSKTKFEYYCLIVDTDFLAANQIHIAEIEFENIVRSRQAEALFEKIVEEIDSKSAYRLAAVRAGILNLVIFLARNHAATRKVHFASDENIKLAIGYLTSNYQKKLTLEQLSREVGLSKCHFAREFKRATGMTVVTYLNTIRCRNARKLLLKQKYSISEIAIRCGFESSSYFTKTYKSIMGCLPSEVRRREGS